MTKTEYYSIGKVNISRTNLQKSIKQITKATKEHRGGYICVSNTRTTAYANKKENKDYLNLMHSALMCLPDGMPLVWMARLWGLKDVGRTAGPDLFTTMLQDENSHIKHFLLGDTEETLKAISEKYNNITGYYSPPFLPLDKYNYKEIAGIINKSNADIVWIALGAPKQDYFAQKLQQHLNGKICIGVGAAFRFSLGEIKHPPTLLKKLGLTGLFWRKLDLKELWWYVPHSLWILRWSIGIIFSRLLGRSHYNKQNKE